MSDAGEPPRKTPPTATADRDDKQSAAGISDSQEFRHEQRRPQTTTSGATGTTQPPQPHELTAEWTVRAQLTFARAGEKVQREFSSNDPVNPVRVVYKWSTFDSPVPPDDDVDIDDSSSSTLHKRNSFASRGSRQSTPLKTAQHTRRWHQQPHESFRSTTSSTNADLGGGDSAFSGSNASKQRQRPYQRQPQAASGGPNGADAATGALYGTRCRSTCNIVVSAVADFLPADAASSAAFASAANEDFASSGAGGGGRGRATTHVTATATDFIPEKEADPFVFNTTASYTVLPQRSIDSTISTGSKDFAALGKVLALRDAFSQTSDTETKYFEEREREYERRRFANSRSPIDRRTVQQQQQQQSQKERKSYEQRRATAEGLLQAPSSHLSGDSYVDEAHSFMPSFLTSPSHTFKSASMSRIPTVPEQTRYQQQQHALASKQKSSSSEPLKKPRTVHIDVYCTGSEDEEEEGEGEDEGDHADADAEASASSNASNDDDEDASKHHDLESTSTPQTVFDNEQLLLKHKRITGQTLPRRLQQPPPSAEPVAPPHNKQQSQHVADLQLGHAITKSSTAEEVSESKQLLFRKHIGDQRAAKLAALRQKYMRQPSDDAISSNYPNSSRSTVRDATCSSIASSVVTSSQAEYAADSSWKEAEDQEEMYSLAKSDSFEYENTTDRLRIKQMECFWSRTSSTEEPPSGQRQTLAGSPVRGHMQSPFLQPISEVSSPFATPVSRHDTLPTESENFSETSDIYYTYPGATATAFGAQRTSPAYLQQTSHFPRNRPGFLQFFGPSTSPSLPQQRHVSLQSPSHEMPATTTAADVVVSPPHAQLLYTDYQPRLQRWKSETRDNLSTHGTSSPADRSSCASPLAVAGEISPLFQKSGSEAPPTTTSAATFHQSPMIARRFEMKHESPAVSEASTTYAGYTVEHLQKAKKFGAVVSTARKPGHHVGPTKNPNCSCESCQRWLAERFQVRSRAFSLGERPILRRASKGNI